MTYSKHVFLILLSIFFTLDSYSQNRTDYFKAMPIVNSSEPDWVKLMYSNKPNVPQVIDLYRSYYQEHEFVKTIHTQNYKYWVMLVEPLLDKNGFIGQVNRTEEDNNNQMLKDKYLQRNNLHNSKKSKENSLDMNSSEEEWVALGPFETFSASTHEAISWHKNIYSIDQSKSNPNILICGTEAGGIYKSTDKAANWSLISKGEVFSGGNSAVKIHPTNPDIFLLSSNRRIYKSIDGGVTWAEKFFTDGAGNEFKYSPSNPKIIFHTSSSGLFKSFDSGDSWLKVFSESCWDIDFHPTEASVVYLLKSNLAKKRCEFFRSDDGGNTWALKDNGYYTPSDMQNASNLGGKIALTLSSPDLVYVCLIGSSKAGDSGWIGVYKSSNNGEDWINPSDQDGGPYGEINGTANWNVSAYDGGYHQGFFNFDLEASPTDSNKIWLATIRLSESTDGGKTFKSIGAANSERLSYIHADVQDIEVSGNDIWIASDGGVNYSNDELSSHVALNKGIQAAHFWGFNTGWNEDTFTGGKYHDGTSGWYENYGDGKAYNIGGVEEASGYVHPIESRKLLFRTHYNSSNSRVVTIPKTFGDELINHSSLPIRANESYSVAERSGIYFDPRYADHIYVGLGNRIYKSIDGGVNFDIISTFQDENGLIYELEISRSNPDVMYCVYNKLGGYWNPCEIWKSTDGGKTWNKTENTPSGNNRRFRISINPEDENNVWVCTPRGDNGDKVSSTTDGGKTWINRTTNVLDDENLTDIMLQGGANELVYLVSNNGVFYWDTNVGDWLDYSLGLPLVVKSLQINPFYRDGELRLGTTGRGVWARKMKDSLSKPIAQPITYTGAVYCSKDSIQFDCYSMLRHRGASWKWSITPEPLFISSDSARNPKVVFGSEGDFDVSLTVTDAQGNSDTKVISDMITVLNSCATDSTAGNSLAVSEDGDYFIVPEINLSDISHFTSTAWIKPDGKQKGFAGIISNGEWCAHCDTPMGLVFDYYGNKLYYRWPGGSGWGNNSGMTVPLDQWSYVAMVVTPDSVTLYLNEQKWVSHVNLNPVSFDDLYIGKGHYSKYFKGNIDEVTIWNRALSQSEIRDLRHITKKDIIETEPALLAYYQFNNRAGQKIFDNAKSNHGYIKANAILETSSAPVGPGSSQRMRVDESGTYNFDKVGLEMLFGSKNPNGEVVVSRLNTFPNSLPNSNHSFENYWIVNNYGTPNFDVWKNIKFTSGFGKAIGNPEDALLFERPENGHQDIWTELCNANNFDNDSYNYINDCQLTNTSQFFIQSSNNSNIHKWIYMKNIDTSICANESIFLGGEWQSTAGIYRDTVQISSLIDSIFTTSLEIIELDTSVTVNALVLISNAEDATYQWISCQTMELLIGETSQTLTGVDTGTFAVEVTQNNCTDTSACYSVSGVGIIENDFGEDLIIFPNPTTGMISINLRANYSNVLCEVFNATGQLISVDEFEKTSLINLKIKGPAAYYIVKVRLSEDKEITFKILKK